MSDRRYVAFQLVAALLLLLTGQIARAADHPVIPAAGATRINPKDGARMVCVPAGRFLMGEPDQYDNPRGTVTLDAFWIYKNDVTVAQFRKFCHATGRKMPQAPTWGWQDDHPVVNVSWDDARTYCDWAGAVLPSEAQWEKASRGTDGRKYPWGSNWDPAKLQCSKVKVGDAGSAAAVGSYPAGASPYGCLDMTGNVSQWCADRYSEKYLRNSPTGNPTGPKSCLIRSLRGGSWISDLGEFFRCAFRSSGYAVGRFNYVGFRCVVRAGS